MPLPDTSIILETERLLLYKPHEARDFEAWAQAMCDEQTMRFIGGTPLSSGEAWRNMAIVLGHWEMRGYGFFSLREKASQQWVGRVGPWNPYLWPAPEIGWTIHPHHTRKGYAREAALACIDYAYTVLEWPSIIHVIGKDNIASQKTAESVNSHRTSSIGFVPGIPNSGPCWIYTHQRSKLTPIEKI